MVTNGADQLQRAQSYALWSEDEEKRNDELYKVNLVIAQ